MASPGVTLEELVPEVAHVFAIQESALMNCMSILTTTISRQEEENKAKATAADIVQLRGDVKKAAEVATEFKKTIQRLEKMHERLLAELHELRQENAAKDAAVATLERQHEQHLIAYEQHLEELDRRFDYVSRIKAEQKEVARRLEMQERSYAELKFGMAMLSKSIGDDNGEVSSIVPLVPLVPVIGRTSPEHRSMKHIMSVAHMNSRRPTLATVAAFTAANQGNVVIDLNDEFDEPVIKAMSRKSSATDHDASERGSHTDRSDMTVMVDVTAAVLARQGSTLLNKSSSKPRSTPSSAVLARRPTIARSAPQTSAIGESNATPVLGARIVGPSLDTSEKLDDSVLLHQATQSLLAPIVQSPPALSTQDQVEAMAPARTGVADHNEVRAPLETESQQEALATSTSLDATIGTLAVEAVATGEAGEQQRKDSILLVHAPIDLNPPSALIVQEGPLRPAPAIRDAETMMHTRLSTQPSTSERSSPLLLPEVASPRKASVTAGPPLAQLDPAMNESQIVPMPAAEPTDFFEKAANPVKQRSVKQLAAPTAPVIQTNLERTLTMALPQSNHSFVAEKSTSQASVAADPLPPPADSDYTSVSESCHEAAMIRSHAEYRYLWHWAYSNIKALCRMHGKQNVEQLLSGAKKDTVGSRVRQIEDAMDAVHQHLQHLRDKVDGLNTMQTDLAKLHQGTTALADQVIDLRGVCNQVETNTVEVKAQLLHLERVVHDFEQSFVASLHGPSPNSDSPRPIEPAVPVAAFDALQAQVTMLETSLGRLDAFMASCASADTATKMKLQAIESTQTTHAQVMEKELGKLAEDNRKKATDHKRDLDDLAACVNAAVDRLYVWVHFVTDAIHLACSPDAPTDSTTYQTLMSTFRSKYAALGAKLLTSKMHSPNSATDTAIAAVCRHVDAMADANDRDVDKCMRSGMQALALLLDNLVASVAVDRTGDGRSVLPLVRLVRESIVEAKALACIGVLFGRFGRVQVTANALATALDDTKGAVGRQAKEIQDLNLLHTVAKALTTKVDYVFNNTQVRIARSRELVCCHSRPQMMIVEDDLKKAVARLTDEREQLRVDLDASIKQLVAASSELEMTLGREMTALASRLHTKVDRAEVGMAHQTMQDEIERLANSVVSHDEFVVLAERLKRKPDANDIRAYVRQKISSLKLAQTDTNSDAPLLGSVPVRCMSCQNVVEAKVQPAASHEAKQREVLPFTTSSMRHVQKHKLDAMMKAKASPK
ncbi:hypothetical protein, variant 1 [Aphanomyces invadans]|uniref:Uncharacterized protein n=1 Tax=Aphanomyces invadans TaxID=157072 RepID=A0A024U3L5_9STRA|nr:hypothetical protein, variant 1 [Aphanomyces invadans]ETW00996.1 hypothetical protein, variant 1 [Aphanomyces invadans]|eukprot:XP_008869994.1 hypothetical protein, variant 1 [Aphanomyces invadans]